MEKTGPLIASPIGLGNRLLDGAFVYGTEAEIGEDVRQAGVPREEQFITTNIWKFDQ